MAVMPMNKGYAINQFLAPTNPNAFESVAKASIEQHNKKCERIEIAMRYDASGRLLQPEGRSTIDIQA